MPSVSEKQHKAMEAAAHGHSTLGIPEEVGKEFVAADGAEQNEVATEGGATSLKCAGVLIQCGDKYLVVSRADTGVWETPGGHLEQGEDPRGGAAREVLEETGIEVPTDLPLLSILTTPSGKPYFLFLNRASEEALPVINDESRAAAWMNLAELSEVETRNELLAVIKAIEGTEYEAAEAMSRGVLASPYRYPESDNLWLFDMRVTGTGTAYRRQHDEYVYRPPENYLSESFLNRCNGLPVIIGHPKAMNARGEMVDSQMDGKEFRDRVVGNVILPYIKGDEVWGVVKVFDKEDVTLLTEVLQSTSPSVRIRRHEGDVVDIKGTEVHIEGELAYLEHLAVCEQGVWDKQGEPKGINLGEKIMDETMQDSTMLDGQIPPQPLESENPVADSGAELEDRIVKRIMEALSAAKTAPVEMALDSAEPEEEKVEEKNDAEKIAKEIEELKARQDSEAAQTKSRLDALSRLPTLEEREEISQARTRADGLLQLYGDAASEPLLHESPRAYRARQLAKIKNYSAQHKSVQIENLDPSVFDIVESQIYSDAQANAKATLGATRGKLHCVTRHDEFGRRTREFIGDPEVWMAPFTLKPIQGSIGRVRN